MTIADGFPGERVLVLPPSHVAEARARPGTARLIVTDCGYFPEARSHGRTRTSPIDEAVVIVCTRGSGWCSTPAGRFSVASGDAIILPPGESHAYGADEADPWTVWWLHLGGQDLTDLLIAADASLASPVRTLSDPLRAVELIRETIAWMERDSSGESLLAAAGAAWHLMTRLTADRATDDSRGRSLEEAAERLRTHLDAQIDVAELAATARLSSSHFAALFRQRYGLPVLQYQTRLRMARARELLDTTTRPIAEIAATVGYADPFYFARQFKRVNGTTPRAYRGRHEA